MRKFREKNIFAKFSHFRFVFASFIFAKFREKVCEMRTKILAFFRETFRSLETLLQGDPQRMRLQRRLYEILYSLFSYIDGFLQL